MGEVFRIEENDTISRQVAFNRWDPEPLYETYGDACAALQQITGNNKESEGESSLGSGLMASFVGFPNLVTPPPYTPMADEITLLDEPGQGLGLIDTTYSENNHWVIPLDSVYDANGVNLSTPFLSKGEWPTLDSITQWIEFQKGARRPQGFNWVCPLLGCGKKLRRPHALKDHLLFHYDIKTFRCTHSGCTSMFATKCNCDRHMKNCRFTPRDTVGS
ncbi:hypothetical protein B0J17DRAFT_772140 [Rhizoctonia solani]|nr:hypothetical protein B0J17DRAFT_772140 [Rhizoctonia solani]